MATEVRSRGNPSYNFHKRETPFATTEPPKEGSEVIVGNTRSLLYHTPLRTKDYLIKTSPDKPGIAKAIDYEDFGGSLESKYKRSSMSPAAKKAAKVRYTRPFVSLRFDGGAGMGKI